MLLIVEIRLNDFDQIEFTDILIHILQSCPSIHYFVEQFNNFRCLWHYISRLVQFINILHIKSTLFVRRISLHSLETIKSHLQNHKIQFIIIIFQISSLVNLSSAIFTVQICFMSLYISIVSLIDRTPDMNISYRDQFIRKFVCKEFWIVLNRFVSKRSLLQLVPPSFQ